MRKTEGSTPTPEILRALRAGLDYIECPKCHEERPRKSFVTFGVAKGECQVCRDRLCRKLYMQRKRAKEATAEQYAVKAEVRESRARSAEVQAMIKMLKSRYLQVTAITRTRIRLMELNEKPNKKTENALAARRALLAKYDKAYNSQIQMVHMGFPPIDIVDMVVDVG